VAARVLVLDTTIKSAQPWLTATFVTHDLPKRAFSEKDQQVAMKYDEPTFLFCSPFIRIHRDLLRLG
jgi:hypothetical protein